MVRKMRQYCRFNFNFHADDIRISSCLKNEIKFFSLVDILQEINKKDPQYIFLHRLEQPLNGTTLYTAVNLQKSYERPDFTPTHSVFPKQLPSEIHIMFSVSDSFKGNFDGVHFNKAPCHHKCDQTVCLISAWKNQKHIILLHRPIYSAGGLSIVLISIYFTFLWM